MIGTKRMREMVYTIGMTATQDKKLETATFAAGCFWGVEEVFRRVKGVKSTEVGYAGGEFKNPTYEDVCGGKTGHAESVRLTYDPKEISYTDLIKIFWENHDPTTYHRQGPDVGSQYRSVIFFHTPEQETLAKRSKEELERSKKFSRPIVTELVPASTFYRAEEYHQQYLTKNGGGTCHI